MPKNIRTDDMRKKMGEILDCVYLKGDEFIVRRKNKPLAALIPVAKLKALKAAADQFLLEFMKNQEDKISDADVEQLVQEATNAVRKKAKDD